VFPFASEGYPGGKASISANLSGMGWKLTLAGFWAQLFRCLLNEGIGCDKGRRGHARFDLGVLTSQHCLGTLQGFTTE